MGLQHLFTDAAGPAANRPDPQVALKRAFNGLRRNLFHDPELPAEYLGSPDLGSLAVRGPFACYTSTSEITALGWDLDMLNGYSTIPTNKDRLTCAIPCGYAIQRSLRADRNRLRAGQSKDDHANRPRVGPSHQNRAVRSIDAPVARTSLQLGAPGGRRTIGHRHAQSPVRQTIHCSGCCGRTSSAPCKAMTWSPAGKWYVVATSRQSSAFTSTRCADYSTTPTSKYPHIVNDPKKDGDSRGVRGADSTHRRSRTSRSCSRSCTTLCATI